MQLAIGIVCGLMIVVGMIGATHFAEKLGGSKMRLKILHDVFTADAERLKQMQPNRDHWLLLEHHNRMFDDFTIVPTPFKSSRKTIIHTK